MKNRKNIDDNQDLYIAHRTHRAIIEKKLSINIKRRHSTDGFVVLKDCVDESGRMMKEG